MKLLRETTFDVSPAFEYLEEGERKVKQYFLHGPFMQAECVNRNKRVYPKNVLENALGSYSHSITKKLASSLGELGHPETPTINLPLASHRITDLHFEGNDIMGKAKILDTPNGRIVKTLIDDGTILGMSSRGLGSVEEQNGRNVVKEDYRLSTVDIVAEPSAPNAFVDGILEGKEWMIIDGVLTEMQLDHIHKEIKTSYKAADVEKVALLVFENFLNKLRAI